MTASRRRPANRGKPVGYGFSPTLMTIALGVLSRSCSVWFGRQGIPASVRALLSVRSAASALPLSGPTNAATPESLGRSSSVSGDFDNDDTDLRRHPNPSGRLEHDVKNSKE